MGRDDQDLAFAEKKKKPNILEGRLHNGLLCQPKH